MKYAMMVLVVLLSVGSLAVTDVKEPKTGVPFPETLDVEGTLLHLAGVGVRTRFVVKVYACALYVSSGLQSQLAGKKDPFDQLIASPEEKLFVLHFVHDVDQQKIREAFQEGLEKNADTKKFTADMQKFLQAQKDHKKDDVLKIHLKQGSVQVDGTQIENEELARAVAAIWLGKKPISDDLKHQLVSRL